MNGYDYEYEKERIPKKGEIVCINKTPEFGTGIIQLIADGNRTIQELYEAWKNGEASPFRTAVAQDEINEDIRQSISGHTHRLAGRDYDGFYPGFISGEDASKVQNIGNELANAIEAHNADETAHENLRGAPNGIAGLDGVGKVPPAQLPNFVTAAGNMCRNSTDTGSSTGIYIGGGSCVASGNTCANYREQGTSNTFALEISGADYCAVHGNNLRGVTGAGGAATSGIPSLPGSAITIGPLNTGGSCGFNIV